MKNKTILLAISISLICVFLISITSVFASELNGEVLGQNVAKRDTGSSLLFAEQKVEWPKIPWPWSKKEKTHDEILKEKKLERMKNMLSGLVKEGTITEEKSDEILKQYEEYIAYKILQIKQWKSLFDQLVEDKVLTRNEADTIKNALHEKIEEKKKAGKLNKEDRIKVMKEVLSELVEGGVLTQDKISEIQKYHDQRMVRMKELKKHNDFWDELVTKGIITQEEAESIEQRCKDFHKLHGKDKKE